VVTAANGIQALARARNDRPDAITLDVMMPDIDGWTVLAAIKGDPTLADIPVILITIVDEKQRGYTLGAADYLVKPVDRERLAHVLRNVCGRSAGNVLIVEDDDASRAFARGAVEKSGWTAREAANGRIALERLQEGRPDAIILDLMMPEMDGFEFIAKLRENNDWRSIPVVVLTAKDMTADDQLRLQGNVRKVFQKASFSREELVGEIRAAIDPGRPGAAESRA
jgi:CheY-like chemotaxis protein